MKIHLHDIVYRRLCDVAAAQRRTKKSIIQDALVRSLGLEGIPITDDDAYGTDDPGADHAPPVGA